MLIVGRTLGNELIVGRSLGNEIVYIQVENPTMLTPATLVIALIDLTNEVRNLSTCTCTKFCIYVHVHNVRTYMYYVHVCYNF